MSEKYSQNDEEEVLLKLFADHGTGRFMDIGAYDGKCFSNTLKLAEMGWEGVCVEPSPSCFAALLANHSEHPKVDIVNAAITASNTPELVKFYDSGGDAISSTDVGHKHKWESGHACTFKEFWVQSLPLVALLHRFGHTWDFMNIDVESTNMDIFSALLMTSCRPQVICVEHDGSADKMLELLNGSGATTEPYHEVMRNGENIIVAR